MFVLPTSLILFLFQIPLPSGSGINNSGPITNNPGSPDTSVQFNCSGSFCGSSDLTWTGVQLSTIGLSVDKLNPQVGNDAGNRRAIDINCKSNSTTSNSNFSDENCLQ